MTVTRSKNSLWRAAATVTGGTRVGGPMGSGGRTREVRASLVGVVPMTAGRIGRIAFQIVRIIRSRMEFVLMKMGLRLK